MEDAILSVKCTLVLHLARATCDREYVTLSNLPYERERESDGKNKQKPKTQQQNQNSVFCFCFVFCSRSVRYHQSINQISIASNKSIDEVKYGY